CAFCFFFSSRRRHTRSKRDWSSDVCSSDLAGQLMSCCSVPVLCTIKLYVRGLCLNRIESGICACWLQHLVLGACTLRDGRGSLKIGRASCRERVEISVVGRALNQRSIYRV